jgi:hypothetical protein
MLAITSHPAVILCLRVQQLQRSNISAMNRAPKEERWVPGAQTAKPMHAERTVARPMLGNTPGQSARMHAMAKRQNEYVRHGDNTSRVPASQVLVEGRYAVEHLRTQHRLSNQHTVSAACPCTQPWQPQCSAA